MHLATVDITQFEETSEYGSNVLLARNSIN